MRVSSRGWVDSSTGPFFTAPADGTLTFTFEGYSASHTDQMVFAFNGDALFTNKSAAVGDVVHETVVQGSNLPAQSARQ